MRFAWLVNPVARTLEVLRLEHGRWLLVDAFGDPHVVRAEPFAALEFDLASVWQ